MFPLHSSSHSGKDVRRFAETLADPNKRLQQTESVKHPNWIYVPSKAETSEPDL